MTISIPDLNENNTRLASFLVPELNGYPKAVFSVAKEPRCGLGSFNSLCAIARKESPVARALAISAVCGWAQIEQALGVIRFSLGPVCISCLPIGSIDKGTGFSTLVPCHAG